MLEIDIANIALAIVCSIIGGVVLMAAGGLIAWIWRGVRAEKYADSI